MIQQIPLNELLPHPLNSNRMDADTLAKLKRHIERFGRYEPLTVRPHPIHPGKFEIVNGHHRYQALQALGHGTATCTIWTLDDDQARLYLATLNRLSGRDVPERRAILLEELAAIHELSELTELLPDTESELRAVSGPEAWETPPAEYDAPGDTDVLPQVVTFMLSDAQAAELDMAIDGIIDTAVSPMTRGEAMVALARFFLKHRTERPSGH
ncbi:MAG: ParB/RepB/Spo0J family partition protein [Planctomycetota bacterium]|nr:ParB/RepB/Spo0J family partition protein [Planctomycetota bacterium]